MPLWVKYRNQEHNNVRNVWNMDIGHMSAKIARLIFTDHRERHCSSKKFYLICVRNPELQLDITLEQRPVVTKIRDADLENPFYSSDTDSLSSSTSESETDSENNVKGKKSKSDSDSSSSDKKNKKKKGIENLYEKIQNYNKNKDVESANVAKPIKKADEKLEDSNIQKKHLNKKIDRSRSRSNSYNRRKKESRRSRSGERNEKNASKNYKRDDRRKK